MFTILFLILTIWIFGKLFMFGIKAAWGISKLLLTVVVAPVILIGLLFCGLIYFAAPLLLIAGVVALAVGRH